MLQQVRFVLPARPAAFGDAFLQTLGEFGSIQDGRFWLRRSDPRHYPAVSVEGGDVVRPTVEFCGDRATRRVELSNTTGIERSSPYEYTHISLDEYRRRSGELRFAALDHVGFGLPWFRGTHPEVLALREALAGSCAYHRFPTGEDWDFILPASPEEIAGAELDPSVIRRPKIEIVSFDTVSVPLIQVDLAVDLPHADLVRLFPEALADARWGSVWVYIDNPYGVDICLVLNEGTGEPDWSGDFLGHRLVPSG